MLFRLKRESIKTYIVPDEFNFTPSRYFKFGKFIRTTSHFQILTSELSDRMLSKTILIAMPIVKDIFSSSAKLHLFFRLDSVMPDKNRLQPTVWQNNERTGLIEATFDTLICRIINTFFTL